MQAIAKVNELKAVFISLVREWRRLRKSSIKYCVLILLQMTIKYEMGEGLMKLSVGIITFNEENRIGKTLDSVRELLMK